MNINMNRLCPHLIHSDQETWIKEQTLETLCVVLDNQTELQYVLREAAKTLRQQLRNHVNNKNKRQVPIADVRKWICEQPPTVLRHAAEIVKRSSLKKFINDRIKLFEDVLTVCICL